MAHSKHPLAFISLATFMLLLSCPLCIESRTHGRDQQYHRQAASGGQGTWCIAKPSTEEAKLFRNIDFSCAQNGVDCGPIQLGGSCFLPNTFISHASYAMNLFYKAAGKHPWNCHFNGTGVTVTQDP
ncbi:major pollen allergen Ole e 10 isoform X2 [Jatropha curcas]|nr:major pollen allergen Ole e 10 isoform X2 [Jatropha curcas]